MTIGHVTNLYNMASAGQIGAPAMPSPGRVASPSAPYTMPSIPVAPILSPFQGTGNMYLSLDGDRAEISKMAFGLLEALEPQGTCMTCENRRYVDQSDDASVSFQTPTSISPNMSAAAVASHEQEHVRNEQASAHRDGREIISQTVTLQYDCCPECGKHYVSGGTTKTTSVSKPESDDMSEDETTTENESD